MPKESTIDSAGVKLHTLDWSGAGRPMILLAGLGDSAYIYSSLALKLTPRFRVLGLTRRGHGRSERPSSGCDLDTLVEDILHFLNVKDIERAILVGHSFAGLEMSRSAIRYPERVEALIFLDALFPRLDPEPDLTGDPVLAHLPPSDPSRADLVSRERYFAFYRRARPAWSHIWCPAIETELMSRVTVQEDGSLVNHHDNDWMNRIYTENWPDRNPEYGNVMAPILAIVPDGDFHQALPLEASDPLRHEANRYWREHLLPWIRRRTEVFRIAAPEAQILELDSPYHHIFIAEEDATVEGIVDFLGGAG